MEGRIRSKLRSPLDGLDAKGQWTPRRAARPEVPHLEFDGREERVTDGVADDDVDDVVYRKEVHAYAPPPFQSTIGSTRQPTS